MQELKIHTQSPWVEYLQYEKQRLHELMVLSAGDPRRRGKGGSKRLLERLWSRVVPDESGCWIWTGAINRNKNDARNRKWPYGVIGINWRKYRGNVYVHRLSYELHNGPVPEELIVRHSCDNTICVRPDHLEVGTDFQNTHDSIERGRFPIGVGVYSAKLTPEKVMMIRARVKSGEMQKLIAAELGVSDSTVSDAASGRLWAHVK